ncbi:DUF1697 domain-containing protein [Microbacterium terricola]|uniref:Pyridoxamine 5'-phosphate oxidase n=1 Tax=Microbacterium terricola TaxID=344163 RepID=A0ABM8DY89_9MICO|nr:DUF1697 domain-containing protein [Microbacterium terricola]UYK38695.1 DUF1697 domain-containing protein [Microbacterium terricola]BDV30617.1 pyridoxamine 5'-phosphate oxidase [Microbacterium terricola]
MTEWIALLRGVNVGGITVRSADLAALFTELGLKDVRTVLASGNVRFEADAAPSRRGPLKASIEKGLADRFGYDAWILLVTRDELRAAIAGFPFDASDDGRQPWVVFCVDADTLGELTSAAASLDADVDPVAEGPGVVYWNPAKGSTTDTAFAKVLAKKTFKSRTTNRNLRTLVKILG